MSDTIDTIRDYSVGDARLTVRTVYDTDPDHSYIGKFAAWRDVPYNAYVYDRQERIMGGPERVINGEYRRLWRDARGRIVSPPDTDDIYSREYRYILPTVRKGEGFREAQRGAEHLDAYARNEWAYIGIVATVSVAGREIGSSSVWGVEGDWRYDPMKQDLNVVRDVVREAIDEAQAFRRTLSKSA